VQALTLTPANPSQGGFTYCLRRAREPRGLARSSAPEPRRGGHPRLQRDSPSKETGMNAIHDDLIERSVNIHWPDGYDPGKADLFAHNTIVIDVPAGKIWAKLIDAAAWPTWYSNATEVVVNDPSGRLSEDVDQLRAYHTWLLIPRDDNSTYVVMEEIGMGSAARDLAQTNPGHMHRGHELWNISLKFACES
jgi:hypothetical protein